MYDLPIYTFILVKYILSLNSFFSINFPTHPIPYKLRVLRLCNLHNCVDTEHILEPKYY